TLQAAPAFAQAGRFAGAPHAAQIPRSTQRRQDSVFFGLALLERTADSSSLRSLGMTTLLVGLEGNELGFPSSRE
ncbi:MAG: hypothetical protein ACK50D_06125, partial [Burkholderiales bacterium]